MTRLEEVRFKVLRNNADYCWLTPREESAPSLRCRPDGEIKMSLAGDFLPYGINKRGVVDIDWLTDEIQPVLYIDGVESKLSVFAAATVKHDLGDTGKYVNLECYDRCWRVRETKTENILHLSAGVNYLEPVRQLLTACGITDILATPTTATLPEAREDWDVGTSYLTIINDLLREINYKSLWFNAFGTAVLQPIAKATAANVQHIFSNRKLDPRNKKTVGIISIQRSFKTYMDIYNAPNVFVCSCANPDKSGIMIATAENSNPQSPISVPRRGRRIVDYESLNNIASQTALEAYTQQKRDKSMTTNEIIECTTLLTPGFGVSDVIGLQLGEKNDPKRIDAVCIEKSWDMQLKVGGIMTHELERVVYNLDD